jgi:hypothetical protein
VRFPKRRLRVNDSDPSLGLYANYLQIGSNAFEFVLDFCQLYPEEPAPRTCARIMTGPAYAKSFLRVLEESLRRHEETYGRIEET